MTGFKHMHGWRCWIGLILLVFFNHAILLAQESTSLKRKLIYVNLLSREEHAENVLKEVIKGLDEWSYWKRTSSKKEADIILNLDVQTHRGMTAWSWGGVTVRISAILEDASGNELWKSKVYKATPNGTNGFNTARATAGKLVKDMQTKFR